MRGLCRFKTSSNFLYLHFWGFQCCPNGMTMKIVLHNVTVTEIIPVMWAIRIFWMKWIFHITIRLSVLTVLMVLHRRFFLLLFVPRNQFCLENTDRVKILDLIFQCGSLLSCQGITQYFDVCSVIRQVTLSFIRRHSKSPDSSGCWFTNTFFAVSDSAFDRCVVSAVDTWCVISTFSPELQQMIRRNSLLNKGFIPA